jgi:DUF4097 and DUF4098 domain-containing protein YvlB
MTPMTHRPATARRDGARARLWAFSGLAVVLVSGLAAGGCDDDFRHSPVLERREATVLALAPQKRLRIETRTADVRIVQSPDDSVRVLTSKRVQSMSERSAEAIMKQIRVTMERSGDDLVLRVREPERGGHRVSVRVGTWRSRRSMDITLTVAVPRSLPVSYETQSGDLEVENVEAPLTLKSTSGDMQITNVKSEIAARTTTGDVVIRDSSGPATVQSTSGDVSAVAMLGTLTVRATSGDVEASNIGGMTRIETSSGSVEALDVAGGANISTSSGDVTARVGGDSLIVETSSGEIDARATGTPRVTSLRASSGDIQLKIRPNVGGRLEMQTATGGMHMKNPIQVETMNRNVLIGRLGGTGQVLIRTASGDITLHASGFDE